MGVESDQEIIQQIGSEQKFIDLFSPSLEEASSLGIHSQVKITKS